MANSIEFKNVSCTYESNKRQVLAVDNVSFLIPAGKFACFIGPSGCGKTTILNMIAGFLKPSSGEILFQSNQEIKSNETLGVVFQDFSQLFPWRTVLSNVEFGLEVRGMKKQERQELAMYYLKLVRLEKFAHSFPHQLSGGMQQRAAIARSLAYNPSILLMDEPFAALDAMTRDEMQKMLMEIWIETKKTVVYITHNVSEAVYLGDMIFVLKSHPGSIKQIIPNPLPRLRNPLDTDFIALQKSILEELHH